MRNLIAFLAFAVFIVNCGEKKEGKKDSGFELNRAKQEAPKNTPSEGVPIDLSNKGVGPISSLAFNDEIDRELAAKGEAKFNTICVTCHMVDQRMIGPAMKGIYERRSPEWVMNMILNPSEMLKEDPIAKALLEEYDNAIMLDQNLTEEEARAVAEYLRTL